MVGEEEGASEVREARELEMEEEREGRGDRTRESVVR